MMYNVPVIQIFIYLSIRVRPAHLFTVLMLRMTEMNDLMPPVQPKQAFGAEDCGIMCIEDPTCTSLSYGKILKFCMLFQEVIGPHDISISQPQPEFVHFNVHQVSGYTKYPAGYRISTIPQFVIRFHYYWPVDWFQASEVCALEGARLAMVDTDEKRKFIADTVANNQVLNAHSRDRFFIGAYFSYESSFSWSGYNGTLVTSSSWALGKPDGTGNCTVLLKSASFKMADQECDTALSYICELL